jgi:hypothetical protein
VNSAALTMAAKLNMPVPFLPGNLVHRHDPKGDYTRKQSLFYAPGGAYAISPRIDPTSGSNPLSLPKIDMTILDKMKDPYHRFTGPQRSLTLEEKEISKESSRNEFRPAIEPSWLRHDRQVLRYFAYFQEPVHESPRENFRIRECVVQFYLEDGTMMITEPKIENSGIVQGTFVKRHRIPKDESEGGGVFTAEDLECGKSITVYSRVFRITSCDEFTEAFRKRAMMRDVGAMEDPPIDNFRKEAMKASGQNTVAFVPGESRQIAGAIAESKEYHELALGGSRKNRKLDQFLANDRHVLCFKCYWEDPTRYGTRHYYVLHYHLADDTVEVHESIARNAGQSPFPVFWRRAKLRKNPYVVPCPGMLEPEPQYQLPEDFIIGRCVRIYNRDIFLYDCDEFTRDFYRQFMRHEQATIAVEEPPPKTHRLLIPPHTGIGAEEDSIQNCIRLQARPPIKDEIRLMRDSDKVLRFQCAMADGKVDNAERRFSLSIWLADDTLGIYELHTLNSGFDEGRFATRGKRKNLACGRWFKAEDFYVGAVHEINGVPFQLLVGEEATFKLMEKLKERFPFSNPKVILKKLEPLANSLGTGFIAPEALREKACMEAGLQITDHELITIARHLPLDCNAEGGFGAEALATAIRDASV